MAAKATNFSFIPESVIDPSKDRSGSMYWVEWVCRGEQLSSVVIKLDDIFLFLTGYNGVLDYSKDLVGYTVVSRIKSFKANIEGSNR